MQGIQAVAEQAHSFVLGGRLDRCELAPAGNAVDIVVGVFATTIEDVHSWSAESPNLYTLTIRFGDEVIEQEIGFRTAEIINGRFLINGKHVRLKGANLHEHHDVTGHVVDEANIESHGYGYDHDKTLGNEAGDGVNLGATYNWIKSRDLSRPVQYETEGNIEEVGERHSDFHSSVSVKHVNNVTVRQNEFTT